MQVGWCERLRLHWFFLYLCLVSSRFEASRKSRFAESSWTWSRATTNEHAVISFTIYRHLSVDLKREHFHQNFRKRLVLYQRFLSPLRRLWLPENKDHDFSWSIVRFCSKADWMASVKVLLATGFSFFSSFFFFSFFFSLSFLSFFFFQSCSILLCNNTRAELRRSRVFYASHWCSNDDLTQDIGSMMKHWIRHNSQIFVFAGWKTTRRTIWGYFALRTTMNRRRWTPKMAPEVTFTCFHGFHNFWTFKYDIWQNNLWNVVHNFLLIILLLYLELLKC